MGESVLREGSTPFQRAGSRRDGLHRLPKGNRVNIPEPECSVGRRPPRLPALAATRASSETSVRVPGRVLFSSQRVSDPGMRLPRDRVGRPAKRRTSGGVRCTRKDP